MIYNSNSQTPLKGEKISMHPTRLLYGADYNPDQWHLAPDIMQADLKRMREVGATSMSVGIFSWTLLEPEEGRYDFGWLDLIMDMLAQNGMKAFLSTPSASKPMWMAHKYPETRRVGRDGLRESPGGRHNHCLSSAVYRDKVAQANRQLAMRYGKHPALALWHLGNELQGECFCENCLEGFRHWLQGRYGSLEDLNKAWWARFWNHTYTDWAQIDPRDLSNDGMQVDWKRFINDQHIRFLEEEMKPLRAHTPDIPCTTNFMGSRMELDYWRWAKVLDVISNDSYPSYDASPLMWKQAADTSFVHDLMRGLGRGAPWLLMECTPSMVNWKRVNKIKKPGINQMEVMQAVAHGADAIHYFQWRKNRGGAEKFHGAVVDHDDRTDTRVFSEVRDIGRMLAEISDVAGARMASRVAVIHDWESQWALNASMGIKQPAQTGIDPRDAYHDILLEHYRGLWTTGAGIDVVSPHDELDAYKIVVAPAVCMAQSAIAERWEQFVRDGGTLVLTHRTAVVDSSNRVLLGGLPGLGLHALAGARVEEVDSLFEGEQVRLWIPECWRDGLGGDYHAVESCGVVCLEGAQPVAEYTEDYFTGAAAVTFNRVGKGEIFCLSANFCDEFYRDFYRMLVKRSGIARPIESELPLGVGVTERRKGGNRYVFLINYTSLCQRVRVPTGQWVDACDKTTVPSEIELPPFGATVCVSEKAGIPSESVCGC